MVDCDLKLNELLLSLVAFSLCAHFCLVVLAGLRLPRRKMGFTQKEKYFVGPVLHPKPKEMGFVGFEVACVGVVKVVVVRRWRETV